MLLKWPGLTVAPMAGAPDRERKSDAWREMTNSGTAGKSERHRPPSD